MASYTELKDRAGSSGTAQKHKLRIAIRNVVYGVFGTIAFLFVTALVTQDFIPLLGSWATKKPTVTYSGPTGPLIRTGDCPGKVHQVTLDANWQTINPHGKCRIIHQFSNHPVEFRDLFGAFPAKGHVARNPESVRATAGTVMSYYSLCPLETGSRVLNWDCTNL